MTLPSISIVTPSFNQGDYLEAAMRSVLDQDYPRLEYVVVDGGSTDASVEIIQRHASRLTSWVAEADGGQYDALNKGFAGTTGEIMGWINSDDVYLPGAFSLVGEIFAAFPQIEWLTSLHSTLLDRLGRIVQVEPRLGYSRSAFLAGENLPGGTHFATGWIQQECTFWRRSLWERAGARLATEFPLAGDFELWARFFKHAELYAVETPLAAFRWHGSQRSAEQEQGYSAEALRAFEKHGGRAAGPAKSWLRAFARCFASRLLLRRIAGRFRLLHPCGIVRRSYRAEQWKLISRLA